MSTSGLTMTPHHAPRTQFDTGTTIGGKYRIVSLIGVGGVGRVYLAKHIELDTDVAIKVLRPEMMERPDVVHRFAREARASVRLRSERIARVYDVGTHEGTPYFVMEHMVGCDLLELRQDESVDIASLCEFFIQACEGLADAHAQGVVHRDIKPDNLFVVREANGWRSLKIFDFGISKFSLTGTHSDVDLASMATEAMMGTPHYISPEQIRATRDVDHRTDIWSLGAVMFEVLSKGVLPFREEREFTALIAEVLEQPHRSLLDVAPNVPEGLSEIVDRCLTKDREQRYQTAAEVAVALLPFAPARARASAERAVATMQAAGLMAINADLDLARTSQPPVVITPSRSPSQPPLPSLKTTVPSLRSSKARASAGAGNAVGGAGVASTGSADDDVEYPRPNRRPLLFGVLGLALAGGLAFAFLSGRLESEATPVAAVQAPSTPAPVIPERAPTVASDPPSQALAAPAPSAASSGTPSEPEKLAAAKPVATARPVIANAARPAVLRPVAAAPKPSAVAKPPPQAPASVGKPELRRER
jgi:serine/threonine-protein kinase